MSKVKNFCQHGITLYCGSYGNAKFESMVDYLNRMHKEYPNAFIVTDFDYIHATHTFQSSRDFLDIRNGEHGVIFAFRNIGNLLIFNNDSVLSEEMFCLIMQQRRLFIKVVACCCGYFQLPRKFRELCLTVIYCKRLWLLNRFIYTCEYDAYYYELRVMARKRPLKMRFILPSRG